MMCIEAVMDPRFKMKLITYCFPIIYPLEDEVEKQQALKVVLIYIKNMLIKIRELKEHPVKELKFLDQILICSWMTWKLEQVRSSQPLVTSFR